MKPVVLEASLLTRLQSRKRCGERASLHVVVEVVILAAAPAVGVGGSGARQVELNRLDARLLEGCQLVLVACGVGPRSCRSKITNS